MREIQIMETNNPLSQPGRKATEIDPNLADDTFCVMLKNAPTLLHTEVKRKLEKLPDM